MKQLMIAAVIASVCAAPAFAEDYFLINGKKIGLHENKKSMTAKLGKPTSDQGNYANWSLKNLDYTANFDQWGLTSFSITTTDKTPKNVSAVVNGKTITLSKDTPKTVKTKLGQYCTSYAGSGQQNTTYNVTGLTGAEGEIYLNFSTTASGAPSDKVLVDRPIDTITLDYENPSLNAKCNY